jgi:hypothetical protein
VQRGAEAPPPAPRTAMRERGAFFGILLTLVAARAGSLVLHFVLPTPSGARVAEHPFELLPAALAGEIGTIAALGLVVALVSRFSPRLALALHAAGGIVLLAVAQTDLELVRWTGEHLNAGWIAVYDPFGDPKILRDAVTGDTWAIAIAALLFFVPAATILTLARRNGPARSSARAIALCAAGAVAGIGAMPILAPSAAARRRACPGLVGLATGAMSSAQGPASGEIREGLATLRAFLGRPAGWFPDPEYPVWHPVPFEEASYAAFRARPAERKPDVLLVVLESARGWELDVRRPGENARAPALHRLWRERGVAFPACIATGYPSVEGLGGIFLGIPGHPARLLLDAARHARVLALPDILKRAGYRRELVTATSTSFERLEDWYARWYDTVHYDPAKTTDEDLASRVVGRFEAPREAPLFLTLFTISTHPPLFRPSGADPRTPREAWLAALGYTDRALGQVFESLRRTPRGRDAVVIVVGDHSTLNPWQSIRLLRLGTPNAGENWTTLLVAGPSVPAGTVRADRASQVDVAPTLLGLLGLDVSNHFTGRDLFEKPAPPPQGVLALRFRGLAAWEGPFLLQARLDDPSFAQKWRWEEYEDRPDPENGDYHHGVAEDLSPGDRARLAELKVMARAWSAVLDGNRLRPPSSAGPSAAGAPGATPAP